MPDQRTVEFDFIGQAQKLVKTLENIEQHIRRVPENKEVNIKAKTAVARKEIDLLQAKLRELALKETDVKVRARLIELAGDVTRAKALIATIPDRKTLTINMRSTIFQRLANSARLVTNSVGKVENVLENAGQAAGRTVPLVDRLEGAFQSFSSNIRRLGPLVTGLGIAIFASLIPAILALTEALVGAVGGIAALGTALAGIAVPSAVAALGVFGRLSKVFQVLQLRQQARDQATAKGAKATKGATDQEIALRNARRQLNDANARVKRAEQGLADARKQASENIAQAEERLVNARQEAADAGQALKDAEVDAYRQIRDAIEDASDAVREYKRAKLDAARAKLDLRQAKLDLRNLRAELGLTGKKFDSEFGKFTDVRSDFGNVRKALAKVGKAKGLDPQEQIDLEKAILDVRDAELGVEDAVDGVGDAQRKVTDTAKEADRLRKGGIGAVESYKNALKRNKDAQKDLNDATKDYNELVKKGIEKSPEVIQAHDNLAEALKNQRRQQQDLKDAKKKTDDALSSGSAADQAKGQYGKLSQAEKDLVDALDEFRKKWDRFWKKASEPVTVAVTEIVRTLNRFGEELKPPISKLVTAWGQAISAFSQDIRTPKNISNLKTLIDGATAAVKPLAGIFTNVFNTLANVAAAAEPELIKLFKQIEKVTKGWSDSTKDTGKVQKRIKPMIDAFKLIAETIGLFGEALFAIFDAAGPQILDFLKFLRDSAKAFADWAKSKRGRKEIADFFKKTLPLAKQVLRFFAGMVKSGLNFFESISPLVTPFLEKVNDLHDGINNVWSVLNDLLGPLVGVASKFTAAFSPLGIVASLAKGAGDALKSFMHGDFLGGLDKFGQDIYNGLVKPFVDAFNWIKDKFFGSGKGSIIGTATIGLSDLQLTIISWGDDIVNAIKSPFITAWEAVKTAWRAIRTWIGQKATDIVNGIVSVFSTLVNLLPAALSGVGTAIEAVLNGIIDIINDLGNGVNKVSGLFNKLPGVPDIPEIPDIPHVHLASGGIATNKILAEIGERGKEAVLPLRKSVFRELATNIVQAMPTVSGQTAAAGTGRAPVTYDQKIFIHSPPATYPDARHTAAALSRELKRRGG